MALHNLSPLGWTYFFIYCAIVPALVWPGELRLYSSSDVAVHRTTVAGIVIAGLMTALLCWMVS